ncbi:MAG TPA: helix-turn-helix transcriptional regulator [Caulobacteraceae bacterium]|jgi:transcriptional regulator with XRE-family HTH domain|nr:helix-turn-helix transcriptional regulator [Caulobacteraceae bacterium]
MEWEKIVAENLRRFRRERGKTQEQLALDAGVALRYVGMVERGETSASVGMLGKLADALDVRPGDFFLLEKDLRSRP